MPKQNPYLYRRGEVIAFRIAVPLELRQLVGFRELTKSLRTSDKHLALPIALELAANAKRLFYDLRKIMSDNVGDDAQTIKKLKHEIQMRIQLRKIEKRESAQEIESQVHLAQLEVKGQAYDALMSQSGGLHIQSQIRPSNAKESAPDTTSALKTSMHRLSEIIPIWILENLPAKSTISAFKFSVSRFEKLHPKLYVETIEQEHINDFIKHLNTQNLNSRTIKKDHSFIRALFTIAISKKMVKSNPAIGATLPKKIKTNRPPVRGYKLDELKLIFNSPVFTSNERPTAGKGEAAYWIPLLLLFTGARREEICQLTTDRVRSEDGINLIDIDAIDDDGQLKTAGSVRLVPIHQGLIELGFLDYVSKMRNTGNRLFPLLERNARGQYGQKWGV